VQLQQLQREQEHYDEQQRLAREAKEQGNFATELARLAMEQRQHTESEAGIAVNVLLLADSESTKAKAVPKVTSLERTLAREEELELELGRCVVYLCCCFSLLRMTEYFII